jgi:hypothetical protein
MPLQCAIWDPVGNNQRRLNSPERNGANNALLPRCLSRRDKLALAQRFSVGSESKVDKVPKGRPNPFSSENPSVVRSGLAAPTNLNPTINRWAII